MVQCEQMLQTPESQTADILEGVWQGLGVLDAERSSVGEHAAPIILYPGHCVLKVTAKSLTPLTIGENSLGSLKKPSLRYQNGGISPCYLSFF